MPKRIYLYLFTEMLPTFLVSILVFLSVLILGRMTQIMHMVVSRGVSLWDVILLVLSILPYFLLFVLPMATLMAVFMAFLRLSSDNEITAVKNAGVSLVQMLPPVALLALSAYACALFISLYALPWGHQSAKQTIRKIIQSNADVAMKEGVFNDVLGKVIVYMTSYSPREKRMEEVLISDERNPDLRYTIVAREGYLLSLPEKEELTFRIHDGVISRVDPNMEVTQNITFDRYDLTVHTDTLIGLEEIRESRGPLRPEEMNLTQLRTLIRTGERGTQRHQMALMEYHQRFALPVACLVLALLGISLGVQFSGAKTSRGMVLGLIIFFVYFILLSATRSLGEGNHVPVALGTWIPNLLFGSLGGYLFICSHQERRIDPGNWIQHSLVARKAPR